MDPYRDPERVLRDRLSTVELELQALAEKAKQLEDATRAREKLEADKRELERQLFELGGGARGSLEALRIASPCKARWDEMVGDDRVRFCGQCAKHVYNFAAMTRAEAVALVAERTGELCVRMYKREDGTVMTSDCPVGEKRKRVRRLVMVGAGLGAAAAAGLAAMTTSTTGAIAPRGFEAPHVTVPRPPETSFVMGDVAVPMGTVAPPSSPPPPPRPKMGPALPTEGHRSR